MFLSYFVFLNTRTISLQVFELLLYLVVFAEDVLDSGEAVQQENEEQLEEVSRRLIIREEQLFSQDSPNEEEEDQLQRDFEALRLQIRMAIQNTFTSSSSSSTTLAQLEVLRSAAASIQQLEEQDLRWMGCVEGRVPGWRPQKCLSAHNSLLQNVVESRLMKTAEEDQNGPDGLSSDLKREVSSELCPVAYAGVSY